MLPNALSIIRIILTVPIVIALLKGQYLSSILLFLLAGVTDALDGWIAKQFSFQSRLGSILDPVADKILLTCTFVSLYWVGFLPLWLLLPQPHSVVQIICGCGLKNLFCKSLRNESIGSPNFA